MNWVTLVITIFGFAKELFKYLNEHAADNKVCAARVVEVKESIKNARISKDTSALERALSSIANPDYSSLHDKDRK